MLGDHRLWAKDLMYEGSSRVPMMLVGTREQMESGLVGHHRVDSRLVGLCDVMPTLLELAGVPVPDRCEGGRCSLPRRASAFTARTGMVRKPRA